MNARAWQRAGLGFLAFTQLVPFMWALLAPASFYDAFPFGAPGWVSLLPPFNEHLVRDVGGLGVALGIVLAGAAVLARRDVTRLVLVAFLVFDIPHAVFHSLHLHGFATVDAVVQSAAFAVQIVLAVVLFVLAGRLPAERPAVAG